ncbi:hypothetical protein, partial [Eggerthella sp. BIOML-A5]|uniref:hypothetical protein n=1 Tax=Eggerthella sp. BIOML-A5 TaxID=2584642 RepID=UPI00137E20B7
QVQESAWGAIADASNTLSKLDMGSDAKASTSDRSAWTSRALALHAKASLVREPPNANISAYAMSRRSIANLVATVSTWVDPAGRCQRAIEGPPSETSKRPESQHSAAVVCERTIAMFIYYHENDHGQKPPPFSVFSP